MKQKHRRILFCILALLVLGFIFGNSLQGGEDSNARSTGVAEKVKPIIDPNDRIPGPTFHILIRKLAHFTEFAALGFCLTGAAVNTLWTEKKQRRMPAFLSLAAACSDEIIQRFTGRTCALKDVCIDFAGAVVGIAFAAAIVWLWGRKK